MTTNVQTIDEDIEGYQHALDQLRDDNAALRTENSALRQQIADGNVDIKLLNARLAAIRHWLMKINDVAGYPVKPMSARALKL